MRLISFPGGREPRPPESWAAELEAALEGERTGPVADSWRELREDVRALAPPIAPEVEDRLRARIAEGAGRRRPPTSFSWRAVAARTVAPRRAPVTPGESTRPDTLARRPRRRSSRRPWRLAAAGALAVACAIAAAVILAGPRPAVVNTQFGASGKPAVATGGRATSRPEEKGAANSPAVASSTAANAGGAEQGRAEQMGPARAGEAAPGGPAAAPGRVQQLAASISLAPNPGDVQATADRVARLTVSDGGFVENSHVQVQQGHAGEANMTLSLPSARLAAALASLGQLAPVRSQSQSLQDITGAYDAARRRLADVTAERQALLRGLARAETQGQIDSFHERLAQASSAIAQARSALQAVSQRASTAEVEVTVVGNGHASSERLTLGRGLNDAEGVLTVTLDVLLVLVAILVPLALVLGGLATGLRAWRRYHRERALDAA
jgi:Domain of unknown function (DUF4349)